ncbi:hypothetical protein SRHO_G00305030 [Serrasalmus rhombeus]
MLRVFGDAPLLAIRESRFTPDWIAAACCACFGGFLREKASDWSMTRFCSLQSDPSLLCIYCELERTDSPPSSSPLSLSPPLHLSFSPSTTSQRLTGVDQLFSSSRHGGGDSCLSVPIRPSPRLGRGKNKGTPPLPFISSLPLFFLSSFFSSSPSSPPYPPERDPARFTTPPKPLRTGLEVRRAGRSLADLLRVKTEKARFSVFLRTHARRETDEAARAPPSRSFTNLFAVWACCS